MLRRRKEGSGQIITKPTEERESAEISFRGQVSEDERQPTPRMATPRVATIRLVSHARFPRDSRGNSISLQPGSEEHLRWSLRRRAKKRANRSTPRIGTTTSWNSGM